MWTIANALENYSPQSGTGHWFDEIYDHLVELGVIEAIFYYLKTAEVTMKNRALLTRIASIIREVVDSKDIVLRIENCHGFEILKSIKCTMQNNLPIYQIDAILRQREKMSA